MQTLGQKLKFLRERNGKNQEEVCKYLNIEQSTLANYENDRRIPKIDILGKLSTFYDIPTDFLLGIGIFSSWDELLKQKDSIISHISIISTFLSTEILNELDDISFIKLVYAFNVYLHPNEDDGTVGITTTVPISKVTKNIFPMIQQSDSNEKKLLSTFRQLSEDDKIIVLGKALDLKRASVAADVASRKTGTDNMGK